MRFIVANYGRRHLGLLLAHLHSIARTHPQAAVSVYWQDIPERFTDAFRAAFPHAQFVKTAFDFQGDPLQRISSKVLAWAQAAAEHPDEDRIFADADTLVVRSLAPFFLDQSAEVIFTDKPEKTALNTGVILARPGGTPFFERWKNETLAILSDPKLFAQANDFSLPYGGTDQMSLYRMLDYRAEQKRYELAPGLRLRAEPCARLNETNSRPITADTHVIHFKGGWQQILLDGRPFSRFRTRAESWEMLVYFLETFAEALGHLNASAGTALTARDLGIVMPWYVRGGKFSAPRYVLWRIRAAAQRARLLLLGSPRK